MDILKVKELDYLLVGFSERKDGAIYVNSYNLVKRADLNKECANHARHYSSTKLAVYKLEKFADVNVTEPQVDIKTLKKSLNCEPTIEPMSSWE